MLSSPLTDLYVLGKQHRLKVLVLIQTSQLQL